MFVSLKNKGEILNHSYIGSRLAPPKSFDAKEKQSNHFVSKMKKSRANSPCRMKNLSQILHISAQFS